MDEKLYKQIEKIIIETENTVARIVKMLENSIMEFERVRNKIMDLK